MASCTEYVCRKCDFSILLGDDEICFSEDLSEYREEKWLMLTCRDISNSPIRGSIYVVYCENCNSLIKVYKIRENNTDLSFDEIKQLIGDKSDDEYDGIKLTKLFIDALSENADGFYRHNDESELEVTCPNCNEKVSSINFCDKCPKCGDGKLMPGFMGFMD